MAMENIGIKNINGILPDDLNSGKAKNIDSKDSFSNALKASLEKVNNLQTEADHAVQKLMLGEDQNLHQVMIAVEKANLSFQMMMQVRNKIISAYEEMMRMQV